MPSQPPPKAILFDIGGVCVISPFQAILDYEIENKIPVGWVNFAIQKGPHDTGAWQLIERGECVLNDEWFEAFRKQLSVPEHWAEFYRRESTKNKDMAKDVPPVPHIDAKTMFWRMMRISREPDPYMYPALRKLQKDGRFVLAALSNTVAFPTGILDDQGKLFTKGLTHKPHPNPYANDSPDIADCFDIFISSAHVGLRKPDPKAYELAVRECSRISVAKGKGEVKAEDVLFLDDIGINLKWAKLGGLRTIKVDLGKTKEAVKALEEQTGMALLDDKARL